ncbi:MAG: hypothetical protein V3W41_09140 [Planctomycetota bacterium]
MRQIIIFFFSGITLLSQAWGAVAESPSLALPPAAQEVTPLSGKVGRLVGGINETLTQFEALIVAPESDLKGTWTKAKDKLSQAEETHKTITNLYSSRFDAAHSDWVAVCARLKKAQADGTAFEARATGGEKKKPKVEVEKPASGGGKPAKLTGGVGHSLKKASESLDQFDKTLARAGKVKLGAWKVAKGQMAEAAKALSKGERDYSGKFDPAHPDWAAAKTRLKASEATLREFYKTKVDGGGTKEDGTKNTGYGDAQSIVPASNPNRRSVDRAICTILMETEKVRKIHSTRAMTSDLVDGAKLAVATAKKLQGRLESSYGSIINRKSDQFLALCAEVETCDVLAKETPALAAAYAIAEKEREAEEKRALEEAKRMSKVEYEAELAKRLKAEIESARFPKQIFENQELEKLARKTIIAHYSNQTLLKLQVRGGFKVKQEARIVENLVEYGTYRYLNADAAMLKKNGEVWVYRLKLRNTMNPDRIWGPQEVSGSFGWQYQMLRSNVEK